MCVLALDAIVARLEVLGSVFALDVALSYVVNIAFICFRILTLIPTCIVAATLVLALGCDKWPLASLGVHIY